MFALVFLSFAFGLQHLTKEGYVSLLQTEASPFVVAFVPPAEECPGCQKIEGLVDLLEDCIDVYLAELSDDDPFTGEHKEIRHSPSINIIPPLKYRTDENLARSSIPFTQQFVNPEKLFSLVASSTHSRCELPKYTIATSGFWEMLLPFAHVFVLSVIMAVAVGFALKRKFNYAILLGITDIYLVVASGSIHALLRNMPILSRKNPLMGAYSPPDFSSTTPTFFSGFCSAYMLLFIGALIVFNVELRRVRPLNEVARLVIWAVTPFVIFDLWQSVVRRRAQ